MLPKVKTMTIISETVFFKKCGSQSKCEKGPKLSLSSYSLVKSPLKMAKVSQAPNLKHNQVEKWNLDVFLLRFIEVVVHVCGRLDAVNT